MVADDCLILTAVVVSLALHKIFPVEYPDVTELEREQALHGRDPYAMRMTGTEVTEMLTDDKKGARTEVMGVDV